MANSRIWPQTCFRPETVVSDIALGQITMAAYGLSTILESLQENSVAEKGCGGRLNPYIVGGLMAAARTCAETITDITQQYEADKVLKAVREVGHG